jgi:hypothetical protein
MWPWSDEESLQLATTNTYVSVNVPKRPGIYIIQYCVFWVWENETRFFLIMKLLMFYAYLQKKDEMNVCLSPRVLSWALLNKLDEHLYCGPENAANFE